MTRKSLRITAFSALALLTAAPLSAAELFRDELASGAGWAVNAGAGGDFAATFGYDYSANSIPEAPNSQGGDTATTGLKAESNITSAVTPFIAYPTGQSFTGAHQLRFDTWTNYDVDERINGGSAGTTEFIGGGIGYDNTSSDVGVGAQIIATNDGGSGSDWRAFADGDFLDPEEMTAGDRNGFNAYYSDFLPGVAPPAGQPQLASPPGTAGSPGFQWITFEINTNPFNGRSTIYIEKPGGERLQIAKILEPHTQSGNIGLYYADLFSSVTSRPDLTFGIFDNVVVSSTNAPEPAAGLLMLLGGCLTAVRRRIR